MCQKIFQLPVIYSLKCIFAFSFQYQSDAQLIIFLFFSSSHFINTFNLVHVLVPLQFSFQFNSFKFYYFFKHNIGLRLDFKHNIDLSLT